MNTGPQLQPDVLGTGQDVGRTAKRSSGGVERGQEAVPGRLHLMSPVTGKRTSDHGIVAIWPRCRSA